jgi:hypothetical protein
MLLYSEIRSGQQLQWDLLLVMMMKMRERDEMDNPRSADRAESAKTSKDKNVAAVLGRRELFVARNYWQTK